ncbi:MAG: hypothetical protein ABI417_16180 [Coleofasciculaceae cyanobacterium]
MNRQNREYRIRRTRNLQSVQVHELVVQSMPECYVAMNRIQFCVLGIRNHERSECDSQPGC